MLRKVQLMHLNQNKSSQMISNTAGKECNVYSIDYNIYIITAKFQLNKKLILYCASLQFSHMVQSVCSTLISGCIEIECWLQLPLLSQWLWCNWHDNGMECVLIGLLQSIISCLEWLWRSGIEDAGYVCGWFSQYTFNSQWIPASWVCDDANLKM